MGRDLESTLLLLVIGLAVMAGGEILVSEAVKGAGNADPDEWVVRLEYGYTYGGERYESGDICPGAGSGCYNQPRQLVEDYPEGENVTVYVDPSNPETSYLVEAGGILGTGVQWSYAILFAMGAIFFLAGVNNVVRGGS